MLSEALVDPDPIAQFRLWLDDAKASSAREPEAMVLATVSSDGQLSARVVLLRGLDERGFVFFTNYESAKGKALDGNGIAAAVFYWGDLERQVRIEGTVARVVAAESDAYFHGRPRGHRLSAWASHQSSVVPGRAFLEERMAAAEAQFAGKDVARPEFWGGYRIAPQRIEFWQGRPDRLHDRLLYARTEDTWKLERLSP